MPTGNLSPVRLCIQSARTHAVSARQRGALKRAPPTSHAHLTHPSDCDVVRTHVVRRRALASLWGEQHEIPRASLERDLAEAWEKEGPGGPGAG